MATEPPQAVLQHTPSAQKPLWHSFVPEQGFPGGFFAMQFPPPQKQLPPGQSTAPTHWLSAVQAPQPVPVPLHGPVQVWVVAGGQAAPDPVQFAGSVAIPAAQLGPRHETLGAWNPSVGQAADVPVQFSAASHTSTAARHTTVAAAKPSAGHVAAVPLQDSGTSQESADARHVTPALPAGCWQLTEAPLH